MDLQRENRIRALGRTCASMTEKEREDYLRIACDGDEELREAVEKYLEIGSATVEITDGTGDLSRSVPQHYQLIRKIGSGGMADVYLAEDTRLKRQVAIKFLNNEFRKDPERMRRFTQEARTASALNHPNILTIHDIGDADENQFIVSEFVDGETLAARIGKGKLKANDALEIALQVASALKAAHKAGIVHRDLKPENVMIRHDESIKVLDFGLAKETGNHFSPSPDRDAKTLDVVVTSPGLILGTPQYMSPEQTRGIRLDGRSDVFSLGIIIFEMVTGKTPFAGNSMVDVIAAIISKDVVDLGEYVNDAPPALVAIVNKALRKNREERYATMDEMQGDLKELKHELANKSLIARITGASRISATLIPSVIEPKRSSRRWIWVFPILAAVIASVWYFGFFRRSSNPSEGQFRAVAITSWNSVASELMASASFSPDARMVAFSSSKSGVTEIWAKPSVGGDSIQVTKNGFFNAYPVWSPNGEEIAFVSVRGENQGIWRAAFTGGQEVQLASKVGASARTITWAKDGFIYFQEGTELFRISERSGEREQISDFASAALRPRTITISDDGSKIAYSMQEKELWRLKIRERVSGSETEVATSKDQFDYVHFLPDGSSLAFSGTVDGVFQVLRATDALSTQPVQISNGPSDVYLQDISHDGTKFLTSSVSDTSDLWMVNTQDSTESVIANDVTSEYWADVSPDGKSVAYQSVIQSDRPYRGSIMVKSRVNVGGAVMVSADGFFPIWSNSGQWVAFFKRSDLGISLWSVKPDGSDAMKIADTVITPGYTSTPYLTINSANRSWSPDDASVTFVPQNGQSILKAFADGSGETTHLADSAENEKLTSVILTRDPNSLLIASTVTASQPGQTAYRLSLNNVTSGERNTVYDSAVSFRLLGLSNDGKNVLIAKKGNPRELSATPPTSLIYSVPLSGGEGRLVNTLNNAYFHNIHLSKDGRTIGFVTRLDDLTALWTVAAAGGTPKRVLVENDPKVLISSLSWSPDSKTIVFGKQTRTNLITMLTK